MLAGDGPPTDAQLLARVPAVNRPGTLPSKLYVPGETPLLELRPSFFGLYWGRLVVLILLFLIVLGPVEQPSYVANPVFWFFEGVILFAILLLVLIWSHSVYAITNRRVLAVSGVMGGAVAVASFDQVTNLGLNTAGSGSLVFDVAAAQWWRPSTNANMATGRIVWKAVPDTMTVYAFVQAVFVVHADATQREAMKRQVAAQLAKMITCSYCRGLINLQALGPGAAKCPRCGAPITASR